MLAANCLGQCATPEAGIELGLDEGAEVVRRAAFAHGPQFFVQDAGGIASWKLTPSDLIKHARDLGVRHSRLARVSRYGREPERVPELIQDALGRKGRRKGEQDCEQRHISHAVLR